jgi:hypothetical protein
VLFSVIIIIVVVVVVVVVVYFVMAQSGNFWMHPCRTLIFCMQ